MNRIGTIALAALVALLVVFGLGWFYGSNRAASARAAESSVSYSLMAARSKLLEGRIDLYNNNFGNASARLDEAKRHLGQAIEAIEKEDIADQAAALRQASTSIDTAIQQANRLEHTAHQSAAAALKGIDGVFEQRSRAGR